MKCPRTGTQLKLVKVGQIKVEISEGCGGVFFDIKELEHFNDPADIKGDVLAKHLAKFATQGYDFNKRIKCPKCPDTVMMRRYDSPAHIVEIDECPSCGGIWLDTGELQLLRDNFLSKRERALLREGLIREVEGSPLKQSQAQCTSRSHLNRVFTITDHLLPW